MLIADGFFLNLNQGLIILTITITNIDYTYYTCINISIFSFLVDSFLIIYKKICTYISRQNEKTNIYSKNKSENKRIIIQDNR